MVQRGEDARPIEAVQCVLNMWEAISIFNSLGIQFPEVYAESKRPIFLANKHHRARPGTVGASNGPDIQHLF